MYFTRFHAVLNNIKKGAPGLVEGSLVSSTYEQANGKGKKTKTMKITSWSIRADAVRKLRPRRVGTASNGIRSGRCRAVVRHERPGAVLTVHLKGPSDIVDLRVDERAGGSKLLPVCWFR